MDAKAYGGEPMGRAMLLVHRMKPEYWKWQSWLPPASNMPASPP
ncbi:monoglyceride lipase-like protein [Corchorus olitorius]|uniref:Monoglyceride lipase-like protein n=1 Tax=Corchorus olitorius TaxID=93759 RepID=A0A1R3IG52_9ROSI|nr:monoglyceride lipase-like protein [Corchorus olitorius]